MLSERPREASAESTQRVSGFFNDVADTSAMNTAATSLDANVELLMEQIASLVRERQDLRARTADLLVLEENRRRIARLQQALSYALIERHRPVAA